MPRKRKLDTEETPAQTAPETKTEVKKTPARTRTRKAATALDAAPEPAVVDVAEQVSEPSPTSRARTRSRKSATPATEPSPMEPATGATPPAEEPAKPARRRKKEDLTEASAPAPVEVPKPARKRTAKKKEEAPAKTADIAETEDELMPIWRPLTRKAKEPVKPERTPPQLESEDEPSIEVTFRSRDKKQKAPAAFELDPDERIEVTFRKPGSKVREESPILEPEEAEQIEVTFRKSDKPEKKRRERGRDRDRKPTDEEETLPADQRPLTAPQSTKPDGTSREERERMKPPVKPAVAIPDDAPQVVLRDGVPTLVRNGRVYPPILFFGNPSDERRATTVIDQIKMAAESGVHLHAHLIDLEVNLATVDDAVKFAGFMLKRSVEADPESQVLFRIVFNAPRGWQDKYPNAAYRDPYGSWAEPSVCDDDFWTTARKCLEEFVSKLRLLDLKDHVLGVHLDRGEWFIAEDAGYDDSRAAQHKFRDWARMRYLNDVVTLRASWFDGNVRFDNIQVPPYQPEGAEGERFLRSSRKHRRYVDYHLFLSDATVHRIGELAYAAKAASDGYFLVGASYGYTFEWSHPSNGHLSLGKLLRTPEIDFIAGPPSYRTREPGGSAAFPGPIDSFALNGKLYLSEEDFKTSLTIGHEPDDFNPPLRTPQALENVHWRGAGAALAHSAGVSWMDLWGNGWLKTPSVWERAAKVQSALIQRMEAPITDPEVAIFIDERALAYLVEPHAFELLVQNVRESVLRAGVSAAFYLLSDLAHREKFPESKLYLFLNAWDIRPELRAAIKSRLQRDNKVLFWLYSAGLFDAGRDTLERAREVTGIALKPQPFHSRSGTTILNKRHPLSEAFPERTISSNRQLEPSYFAIPEGAIVLGEYTQTGLPSFVVKEFREGPADTHWTSVFLGEPQVNPALIRTLAQMAGVHVWNFQDDVVHVRPPFLSVHCTGPGTRTIAMPPKFAAYNCITSEWASDGHNVRLSASDGATLMLLVGPREELDHLLSLDPEAKLKIDKLPPRESNVLHDISNFDVPIMRLDEWIEGGESDEVADEWFLRPPQITEEPEQATESPERIGRRRRRRRGGRERNGNGNGHGHETTVETSVEDDEFGISVVFRKRD